VNLQYNQHHNPASTLVNNLLNNLQFIHLPSRFEIPRDNQQDNLHLSHQGSLRGSPLIFLHTNQQDIQQINHLLSLLQSLL
jgi:hypothetical protein